jgi:hypothetical protein
MRLIVGDRVFIAVGLVADMVVYSGTDVHLWRW